MSHSTGLKERIEKLVIYVFLSLKVGDVFFWICNSNSITMILLKTGGDVGWFA